MVIDLVVGLSTSDQAGMGERFDDVQAAPGVEAAVYTVGPSLLFVGMMILTLHAAARRRLPVYAPVLVASAVAISGLEQAVEVPLRLMMAAAVILLWFAARPIADRMREPARTTA